MSAQNAITVVAPVVWAVLLWIADPRVGEAAEPGAEAQTRGVVGRVDQHRLATWAAAIPKDEATPPRPVAADWMRGAALLAAGWRTSDPAQRDLTFRNAGVLIGRARSAFRTAASSSPTTKPVAGLRELTGNWSSGKDTYTIALTLFSMELSAGLKITAAPAGGAASSLRVGRAIGRTELTDDTDRRLAVTLLSMLVAAGPNQFAMDAPPDQAWDYTKFGGRYDESILSSACTGLDSAQRMSLIAQIGRCDSKIEPVQWESEINVRDLRDRLSDVCVHLILLHCGQNPSGIHNLSDGAAVDGFVRQGSLLVKGDERIPLASPAGSDLGRVINGDQQIELRAARPLSQANLAAAAMSYSPTPADYHARYNAYALYGLRTSLRVLDELLRSQPAGTDASIGRWYPLAPPNHTIKAWHLTSDPSRLSISLTPDALAPITVRGSDVTIAPGELIDRMRTTLYSMLHSQALQGLLYPGHPGYSTFGIAKACAMDGPMVGDLLCEQVYAKCLGDAPSGDDAQMDLTFGLLVTADAFGTRWAVEIPD